MREIVHGAPAFRSLAGWEHLADLSYRFLLPAAALTSLFLGLALLLGPLLSVDVYVPFALVAVGLAALASSNLLRRWKSTVREPGEPEPVAAVAAVSPRAEPSTGFDPRPPNRLGNRLLDKGSEWRVLSDAASPGDETWISWLPRERRRLGPVGDGLATGVVRSPGKAGNLVAFPVRNYHHGVRFAIGSGAFPDPKPLIGWPSNVLEEDGAPIPIPTPTEPSHELSPRSRVAHPLSEKELDRLFPPDSDRGHVLLPEAPDRVGGRTSWTTPLLLDGPPARLDEDARPAALSSPSPMETTDRLLLEVPFEDERADPPAVRETTSFDRSGSVAPRPLPDEPADELSLEAANPVPPHLRAADPHARYGAHQPARRSSEFAAERSVCASCSKVVVNLRMSGPCPKCLRPICSDCLRDALATQGHGWCVDCSSVIGVSVHRNSARPMVASTAGLGDRERRPIDGMTFREAPERR